MFPQTCRRSAFPLLSPFIYYYKKKTVIEFPPGRKEACVPSVDEKNSHRAFVRGGEHVCACYLTCLVPGKKYASSLLGKNDCACFVHRFSLFWRHIYVTGGPHHRNQDYIIYTKNLHIDLTAAVFNFINIPVIFTHQYMVLIRNAPPPP